MGRGGAAHTRMLHPLPPLPASPSPSSPIPGLGGAYQARALELEWQRKDRPASGELPLFSLVLRALHSTLPGPWFRRRQNVFSKEGLEGLG